MKKLLATNKKLETAMPMKLLQPETRVWQLRTAVTTGNKLSRCSCRVQIEYYGLHEGNLTERLNFSECESSPAGNGLSLLHLEKPAK
jgi:hypothetical protein